MIDEDTMSFQEWSDAGYLIIKGSTSHIRDEAGNPQFTRDQVRPKPPVSGIPGFSYIPMEYANTPWQRPAGSKVQPIPRDPIPQEPSPRESTLPVREPTLPAPIPAPDLQLPDPL